MPGGARPGIRRLRRKLRACDIFVLLVSTNSMGSDYIIDKEIKIARERQANGRDSQVYPLFIDRRRRPELDQVQRLQSASTRREAVLQATRSTTAAST